MARDKCWAWAMLGLMMCAVVQVGGVAPSPSPSVDCNSALLNLADCLSYVQAGSTVAKPDGQCCSGLKKVVKEDVACLCEAFKASSSFGVNMTKALSLPQACGVSTPPISECHISIPGVAPSSAPSPSASPGGSIPGASGASGPSPGKSSMAAASPAPFLALLVSVAMPFYSY